MGINILSKEERLRNRTNKKFVCGYCKFKFTISCSKTNMQVACQRCGNFLKTGEL
jgi:hypothetical protein